MTKTDSQPGTTPRPSVAPEAVKPQKVKPPPWVLTDAQTAQVDALDGPFGDYKALVGAELTGLAAEALEGYVYGERTRYDYSGKKWEFRRDQVNDQFTLSMKVSVGPLVLSEKALTLDRVASLDGERQIIALVEQMNVEAAAVAKAVRAYQRVAEEQV